MKKIIIASAIATALYGCATPHVVDEHKVGDQALSCSGIQEQIEEAARFEEKARDEKGVTGTNVAAAIFFWPAMVATYSNANDAIKAADERKRHLQSIYEKKRCEGGSIIADKDSVSGKIAELDRLHKEGSLTDNEYTAAKKQVLGL